MAIDPSSIPSLLSMSAPGLNRSIGAGDVVPFQRTSNDSPNASQAQAATPGPSSPGASFDPFSSLSNLSALTPQYNAAIQALLSGSVPSGTAQAVAQPLPAATPGPSSSQVASQASLGSVPIAGAAGAGLAPQPVDSTPSGDAGVGAAPGTPGDTGGAAGAPGSGPGTSGDTGGPPGDTGDAGAAAAGSAAGAAGAAAGDAGGTGGGTGDGGASGGGDGAMKKGGFVTKGDPKSKTDDVSAKLQHGEFVIPRDAVHHLAATAPEVLSHVMHISAMHHLANKAKENAASQPSPGAMLTGQNGGMPPQQLHNGGPVGYRNGGMVMPGAVVPQIHPAALDLIRRAIAAHVAARPMAAGPAQPAQAVSPAVASVGRPPAVPPMERLDATKNATGGFRNAMTRSSVKV